MTGSAGSWSPREADQCDVTKSDLALVESGHRPGGQATNKVGDGHGSLPHKTDSEDSDELQNESCCFKTCAPESRPGFVILKLFFCVIAGVIFGWCMEKSRVFEPASIRLQMVMKRWVMLKMFIAAVAAGQIALSLLSVIPWCKDKFQTAFDAFTGCFCDKGILTSILGPFILGMGMTLSGACPGMVLPQIGSWAKNSIYTFLGVLVGALVYGLLAPFIVRITKPKTPIVTHSLDKVLKVPFIALALPMGLVLGTAVVLMEVFIPYQDDLDCWNRNHIATPWSTNVFTAKSWFPGVSGAVVGLLQIVVVFVADDTLGGSSAYVTIISQWVVTKKMQRVFPYLAKSRCGLGNWWQVFYVAAAVGGGAFSALASQSIATAQGVDIPSAICGGFLLLIGARFAAGCTSGHGLSGMALLHWVSFLAVPAMFAGAIALGFIMQATGALYNFQCHDGFCPPDFQTPTTNCTGFTM